ncbi:MAG TPA: hypothetical protein VF074_22835 [Pyrinomonadaceae bacterium]
MPSIPPLDGGRDHRTCRILVHPQLDEARTLRSITHLIWQVLHASKRSEKESAMDRLHNKSLHICAIAVVMLLIFFELVHGATHKRATALGQPVVFTREKRWLHQEKQSEDMWWRSRCPGLDMTDIILRPRLVISHARDAERAFRSLEKPEKNCSLSNSIKTVTSLEPEINFAEQ